MHTDYFPGHCWCLIDCRPFNRHHNRQRNEKMQNHQFSFSNYHAFDYCTEHPRGWPWGSSAPVPSSFGITKLFQLDWSRAMNLFRLTNLSWSIKHSLVKPKIEILEVIEYFYSFILSIKDFLPIKLITCKVENI